MKNTKKKGFTLVELLVVIAILAILASVSVVGYTAFIGRAQSSAAETTMIQVSENITNAVAIDGVEVVGDVTFTYDDALYVNVAPDAEGAETNATKVANAIKTLTELAATEDLEVELAAVEGKDNMAKVVSVTYTYEKAYSCTWTVGNSKVEKPAKV